MISSRKKRGKPDSGVVRLTNKKAPSKRTATVGKNSTVVLPTTPVKTDAKTDPVITVKKTVKTDPVITSKQTSSKTSVIYLGHLPDGFQENELRGYFSQFGKVVNVRLSRSLKTGRSRGYGWLQFTDPVVARIAADTMNNYLMGEKILKCEVVSREKLAPKLFHGSGKAHFRVRRGPSKLVRRSAEMHNRTRTAAETEGRNKAIVDRIMKRNRTLKKMGIDYQFVPPLVEGKQEEQISDLQDKDVGEQSFFADESNLPFSFTVDTSDDELEFRTPPNTVKRKKSNSDTKSSQKSESTNRVVEGVKRKATKLDSSQTDGSQGGKPKTNKRKKKSVTG